MLRFPAHDQNQLITRSKVKQNSTRSSSAIPMDRVGVGFNQGGYVDEFLPTWMDGSYRNQRERYLAASSCISRLGHLKLSHGDVVRLSSTIST